MIIYQIGNFLELDNFPNIENFLIFEIEQFQKFYNFMNCQ